MPVLAQDEGKISFVSPRHLSTVIGADSIELRLDPPRGATVDRVEVRIDGDLLGTLTGPPWTMSWDAGDGTRGHSLEALLFLDDGTRLRAAVRTSPLRINQFEEVGLVNLYAVVRDKQRDYVSDLVRDDFRILEDGRPQTIERFSTERKPLRVGIVLDTSLTMEGKKLMKAKRAAMDFLDTLDGVDEGMVVTFSDTVTIAQEITSDKRLLGEAIESASATGGTALYDAIWRSARKLRDFEGRRVLVLLSDGKDEARSGLEPGSLHTMEEALEQALRSEVMVFSIGLGRYLHSELDYYRRQTVESILRRLAEDTGGRALISSSANELRKAFKDVAEDLRNQYSIAYVSDDEALDGKWREIRVLTPGRKLEVITRKGYFAPSSGDGSVHSN
jgi:VWFA-related protein